MKSDVTEQLKDYVTDVSVADVVNQAVADSEQFVAIQTDLADEVTRAKAAEKEIYDSIETISETLSQATEDLNKIFGEGGEGDESNENPLIFKSDLDSKLENYYSKEEANAKFLVGVRKTADEYQALVDAGEVDENVLYIII